MIFPEFLQRLKAVHLLKDRASASNQDQGSQATPTDPNDGAPVKLPRRGVHYLIVVAIMAAFFTSISNVALWRHVYQIIADSPNLPFLFVVTVPAAIFLLMYAIFLIIFSWKYVLKPAFVLLLLTGALATYAAWSYGTIFDSGMITNVIETNPAEAGSYISLKSVATFMVLGLMPAIILLRVKVYYPKLIRSNLERVGAVVGTLALAALTIIPFYQQYSFVGRNNNSLSKEILPTSYVWYSFRHVKDKYFTEPMKYVRLGGDSVKTSTSDKPKLMFLVIGETARAQNFERNGYHRPTNRFTNMEPTLTYNISSCGTYTAYSLPCMFSNLKRADFDTKIGAVGEVRDCILQVLKKGGVKVTWVENDGGCKGVCKGIDTIEIDPKKDDKKYCNGDTCYDEVMLSYADKLSQNVTEDSLVVFHIIGSHGPRYYERYPEKFRKYVPDCNRPDVENCSTKEVVNAYDNTIAYTDYVLYQLIEILESKMDTNDTMLLYVSDHGESLGEGNLYLHAAPYAFAPEHQTRVPMQLWFPTSSANDMQVDLRCMANLAQNTDLSHDHLFHTLMGMFQVRSHEYDQSHDLLAMCPLPAEQAQLQVIPHPEEHPNLEP